MSHATDVHPDGAAFSHEALFFAGRDAFVERAGAFVREGVEADEGVLVVVTADKASWLREELGGDARHVDFRPMEGIGRNPSRIIPVWLEFLAEAQAAGRGLRGIGEPVWAERSVDELVECQRHEALLNLAFADAPAWRLLCPYDTEALGQDVLEEAERTHPLILADDGVRRSSRYGGLEMATRPFTTPLPEPSVAVASLAFSGIGLDVIRRFVSEEARARGLSVERADDFVLAVNEIVSNSVRHAGGGGLLRLWSEGGIVVCEVRDDGRIDEPLVGRSRPATDQEGGIGLWLVNQLCDLVQIRVYETGSVVRLHVTCG